MSVQKNKNFAIIFGFVFHYFKFNISAKQNKKAKGFYSPLPFDFVWLKLNENKNAHSDDDRLYVNRQV